MIQKKLYPIKKLTNKQKSLNDEIGALRKRLQSHTVLRLKVLHTPPPYLQVTGDRWIGVSK